MKKYRSQINYEQAKNLINDEKVWPVFIPTYNRPDAKIIKLLSTPELENFPAVFCIRREQQDLYKNLIADINSCKLNCGILLLDHVKDIAETRKQIVEKISGVYDNIFMFDDDIDELDFLLPSVTKNGVQAMRCSRLVHGKKPRWIDVLKMWMLEIYSKDKKLAVSGPEYRPFSWPMKNCNAKLEYNSKAQLIQAVHLNLKLLNKHNINYRPHKEIGNEDMGLLFDVMNNGLYILRLTDLMYGCPAINSNSGGCENANGFKDPIERYNWYVDNAKNFYGDHPGIRYRKSKTGLKSVKFNWKYWRKYEHNN